MSVSPHVIKQLLQLQMLPSTPLTGQSKQKQTTNDGLFTDMLSTALLAGYSGQGQMQPSSTSTNISAALSNTELNWHAFMHKQTALQAAALSSDPVNSARMMQASGEVPYEDVIMQASARYRLDPSLVKGVIQAESSFNPHVVSSAGAKGLMQLMDSTAQGLGVADAMDPVQNIDGGTRYLASLLQRFNGDEAVALAAYNAGPSRISRMGIVNELQLRSQWDELPRETQQYIDRVLTYRKAYQ